MTKMFVYDVNGTQFEDTQAFGQGWKNAKKVATEEHATITRAVVEGEKVTYEFFAKGGVFLNEKFYEVDRAKVF